MNSRFVPEIEKPCPANWDEMKGDEKRRFCEHCQLHVHNLSAMTTGEQRDVVGSQAEEVCITYVAKPNAKVVGPDAWLRMQGRSWLARAAGALLASLSSIFLSSCFRTMGMICPPQPPPKPRTTQPDAKGPAIAEPPSPASEGRAMGRRRLVVPSASVSGSNTSKP